MNARSAVDELAALVVMFIVAVFLLHILKGDGWEWLKTKLLISGSGSSNGSTSSSSQQEANYIANANQEASNAAGETNGSNPGSSFVPRR